MMMQIGWAGWGEKLIWEVGKRRDKKCTDREYEAIPLLNHAVKNDYTSVFADCDVTAKLAFPCLLQKGGLMGRKCYNVHQHHGEHPTNTHLFQTVHVSLLSIGVEQWQVCVGARFHSCCLHYSQDVQGTLNIPAHKKNNTWLMVEILSIILT